MKQRLEELARNEDVLSLIICKAPWTEQNHLYTDISAKLAWNLSCLDSMAANTLCVDTLQLLDSSFDDKSLSDGEQGPSKSIEIEAPGGDRGSIGDEESMHWSQGWRKTMMVILETMTMSQNLKNWWKTVMRDWSYFLRKMVVQLLQQTSWLVVKVLRIVKSNQHKKVLMITVMEWSEL